MDHSSTKLVFRGVHEVCRKRINGGLSHVGYFDSAEDVLKDVDRDEGYEAIWVSLNPLPRIPDGFNLNELRASPIRSKKEWYTHTDESFRQLGRTIGENINQALLMGRSRTDAFKAIMVSVMELIIQMTILKKLQKDTNDDSGDGGGGSGGLFGGFLSGLFGGHKAGGGPLDPGKWYIASEHGPEPIWGGGPGAFAAGYGKGGSGVVVNYNIDARGSSTTETQFKQSLQESEKRAVQRAVTLNHDISRRK